MNLGTYNADTKEGCIKSRYDIDADEIQFFDLSIEEYHKLKRAVRSIEKAAYDQAVSDVMDHVCDFRKPS